MDRKRALVIGAGPMGLWMARNLARRGYSVAIYDKNRNKLKKIEGYGISAAKSLKEALSTSSLIVLAVGASNAAALLPKLMSTVSGKTILDISSIKTPVAKALAKHQSNSNMVVLVHPLFGPGTKKLKDKNIVFIPFRKPIEEYRVCEEVFHPCKILRMSVETHDRKMASAMALPRLLILALLKSWSMADVKPLTVSQKALMLVASPMLSESPNLFKEITEKNPYTEETLTDAVKTLNQFRNNPSTASRIFKQLQTKKLVKGYAKIYQLLEEAASKIV
ncbi:MAG: prephenate dehydrogenase/arogenate dehydrogenase family protein [Aigarchaeota archaeon]|nr:prephenate dehydrogenase/arogenate dehydrogenase family protein [Candidatus Caldarchaeales archaeon]